MKGRFVVDRPFSDMFPLPFTGGDQWVGMTLRQPTPLRLMRFAHKSRCPSRKREGNDQASSHRRLT